jgi:hypothetical protein
MPLSVSLIPSCSLVACLLLLRVMDIIWMIRVFFVFCSLFVAARLLFLHGLRFPVCFVAGPTRVAARRVYKPVAFELGLGRGAGAAATFAASGLLHESIYAMQIRVAPGTCVQAR